MLEELKEKVGERLAALIGTEDALVTTGAAGASPSAPARRSPGDTEKIRRLPDLTGMKTQVVIQKVHRTGYDHAVRSTGRLVEVETEEELVRAITDQTAMMFFLGGTSYDWRRETPIALERCLEITRRANVPLMVDAANMLPPWGNLRRLASLGVDLICISGGKHMRGPQCSGILAERRDLIQAAWLNSSPHSDSHGRPMKSGAGRDGQRLAHRREVFPARFRRPRSGVRQAGRIHRARALRGTGPPAAAYAAGPHPEDPARHGPLRRGPRRDHSRGGGAPSDGLMEGEPRIAVGRAQPQGVELTVFMNEAGDEKIAVRRIKEIFRATESAAKR